MTLEHPPLPPAQPAATLILMREQAEGLDPLLLMVERSARMAFAAGAAVFPGGRVDEADFAFARNLASGLEEEEAAARLAAIRETLEETGLAIALGEGIGPQDMARARRALHAGEPMDAVCLRHGWTPDLHALTPWARWRPPTMHSRNFDTRFYIVPAPAHHGEGEVDHMENHSLFWASAAETLDRADKGQVSLIYPTRRNLERLAQFDSFAAARAHALDYPVRLVLTYVEERDDGAHLCIPDGLGYPVLSEPIMDARRG